MTRRRAPAGRSVVLALAALVLVAQPEAARAGGWLAPGDAGLRDDLSRLVDEGVIDLPMLAWPIHSQDVRRALDTIPEERELSASQQVAVARLRSAVEPRRGWQAAFGGAYEPRALRRFSEEPREEGELALRRDFGADAWSAELNLRLVADPDDGQELRPDGSYVERRFGNWAVTAGWLERWWGPGWEGSTILGTAARPVPALSIDRALTSPFETRWLSWLGPWSLNFFAGAMENERQDRDHPVLMGLRVSARPLKGLEIALERTAQWCAEGLPCDFDAFWNVLWGNDNQGENVDPEDEPGNQLAGWSIRWASPIGDWPYAFYTQTTGEAMGKDTIPKPVQRLSVRGMEIWGGRESGRPWRLHYEYADTTCSVSGQSFFDCAYNNGLFDVEGYRFRGRPVGHALDGDGRLHALGMMVRGAHGATWQFVLRQLEINRGGTVPDTRHTLSPGPLEVWEGQVRADFDWLGGRLSLGLSAERQEPEGGERETEGRGFVTFERAF